MPDRTSEVESNELDHRAWALRSRCWDHYDIADELKISVESVKKILKRVAARRVKEIQENLGWMC